MREKDGEAHDLKVAHDMPCPREQMAAVSAELASAQQQVKISTGEAAKGEVAQMTMVQLQEENDKLSRKV